MLFPWQRSVLTMVMTPLLVSFIPTGAGMCTTGGASGSDSRRTLIQKWLAMCILQSTGIKSVNAVEDRPFISAAFPKRELTNTIIASRDTNVSPMEVYETLQEKLRRGKEVSTARALDVGAGAGVSAQVLYQYLGYNNIDAVDWSGEAWQLNVVESGYCPPSVNFFELDDERFVLEWKEKNLPQYDVIAFNFAVNRNKALFFCKNLLKSDGLLLAPVNTQTDYWLKQTYQLLDASGQVLWSANDVGAWSVQFQPDVTSDTCQGVWCSPYNGFKKLGTLNR